MFSFSLHQILTLPSECLNRNRDSSGQATFLQSSTVQFWGALENCSLFFLFVVEMSGTRWGLLLLLPIRLKVVCVVASQMLHSNNVSQQDSAITGLKSVQAQKCLIYFKLI